MDDVVQPFFASDPMLSSTWHPCSYPPAFQHADKTYACWQFVGLSGRKGIHVAAYDHLEGAWGERYTLGNFLLANDDHGYGSLIRDADGYIHCLFGSHNSPQCYSVTNNPGDVSSWTQRPNHGTLLTYPGLVLVGSTIHMLFRYGLDTNRMKLALTTLTPVDGIGTWTLYQTLVDFGTDSRVYRSEVHVRGTEIHFTCCRANAADTYRKGIYYFIYDTTTGQLRNYDGTVTVTSLPVQLAQANSDFRVYDHGTGTGDMASLQFDTSGNAHLLFAASNGTNFDLKHMVLGGTAETIATITDRSVFGYVNTYSLVPGVDDAMEAWYPVAGNMTRRILAGGTWSDPETMASGANEFVSVTAVRDANPELRTLYGENTAVATDSTAILAPLYAHGDGGPLTAAIDMSPVDPHWEDVVLLLGANSRDGSVRVIDESKPSVPMTFSGNAHIDGGAIRFDGNGDFLTAFNSPVYSVAGTSDFCIDGWLRRGDLGRVQCLLAKRASSGNSEFALYLDVSNRLQCLMLGNSGAVLNIFSQTAITDEAYFEISRIDGVTYLFVDGNLGATGTQTAAPAANSQALSIGRDPSTPSRDFNGWLTLRFTRAGRHSSPFTPDSTPFPRR